MLCNLEGRFYGFAAGAAQAFERVLAQLALAHFAVTLQSAARLLVLLCQHPFALLDKVICTLLVFVHYGATGGT